MNKADSIKERLEAALDRIETAVEAVEQRREMAGESGEFEARRAAEADKARLQGELETLKGEHAEFREITDTVSQRLDAAIGELRAVLEG